MVLVNKRTVLLLNSFPSDPSEGKGLLLQSGPLHEFAQNSRFNVSFAMIGNRDIIPKIGMPEDSVAALLPNLNPSSVF